MLLKQSQQDCNVYEVDIREMTITLWNNYGSWQKLSVTIKTPEEMCEWLYHHHGWIEADPAAIVTAKCPCDDPDYKGVCDCLNGDLV